MRKRQSLSDAQTLSFQLMRIETALVEKRLTVENIAEIDAIAARVHDLKEGKIIVAPPLLQRVKALSAVVRSFRSLQQEGAK